MPAALVLDSCMVSAQKANVRVVTVDKLNFELRSMAIKPPSTNLVRSA